MRIIAGIYGSRIIEAPPTKATRPTTDRMKESMMSALFSHYGAFDEAYVLDAFAGSGALGIECLSRGAAHVDFFENGPAFATVKKNISTLGLEQQAQIFKSDIYTAQLPHTYDIVFLDPPYKTPQADIWNFIAHLFKQGALSPKAHIVYEYASQEDVAVPVSLNDICTIQKQRAFGEAAFSLLAIYPAQPH